MNTTIYITQDSTIELKIPKIVNYLNSKCRFLSFAEIPDTIKASDEFVKFPRTHNKYAKQINPKLGQNDFSIVITQLPYDNYFFYEEKDGLIILSFFGWKYLTSLPIENGLVYFICGMMVDEIVPFNAVDHTERLGCVNDFLYDKTRVDDGMRKGHLCGNCKKYIAKHKLSERQSLIFSDITLLLKDLSIASSNNSSIISNKSDLKVSETELSIKRKQNIKRKKKSNVDSVFISYSHKDEKDRMKLEDHLKILQKLGLISIWTDRKITGGEEWKGKIDDNIKSAKIILMLISSNFMASDYCYDIEMATALARHKKNETTAIPVILRDCLWQIAEFAKLQALPLDGRPIQKFTRKDDAHTSIARAIAKIIKGE